jgi:hypothetical protein
VSSLVAAVIAGACGPSKGKNPNNSPDAMPACTQGQTQCNGQTLQTCDANGTFMDTQVCANACDPQLGCVLCVPGSGTCSGNTSMVCNASGSGYDNFNCDPLEGSTCDATSGACTGPCAPAALGLSYIGCEYYPTVTGNMVGPSFGYAIAVANTASTAATVDVRDGGLTSPMTFSVPANSVVVQVLPWQADLKLCLGSGFDWSPCASLTGGRAPANSAALVTKGAYHLRSTVPVTVYQFNALNYEDVASGQFSYTNDASLLLPTNVWRNQYYVASWQNTLNVNPDELAVVASQDNTMVTLTTRADTDAYGAAPAFATGVPQTVSLNAGDAIEIASFTGDLTGSNVTSDKPVQVIGGHYCADVPDGVAACDHLEESMFSVDSLSKNYIVNAPAVTTIPTGKVEVIRVIATTANTTLTYNPPQAGAPTTIANPGDFIEIADNANSFEISADHKVLVAQYMEGQDAGGGTGDPAMALAVPIEQFRTTYLFHAPTNYESNYVDVTAPMGDSVMLDGTALTFTAIGTTGYGIARVYPLTAGPGNDGNHSIIGTMPFGITVYGYGQYTAYWYPGGLNLTDIVVN